MAYELTETKEVKRRHTLELLTRLFVVGVGVGTKVTRGIETNEPCITVFVGKKLPSKLLKEETIPSEIEGIKTDVIEIGACRKSDSSFDPKRCIRHRPAPGGVSVSHYARKGRGTLGSWVKDSKTGEPLLLSCWHVIANMGMCTQGDPIIQPSWLDGGRVPRDTIAFLERWVEVKMLSLTLEEAKERIKVAMDANIDLPINYVDAAIAKPISEDVVSWEILGLGAFRGPPREPELGEEAVKSGAATGVTHGRVSAIDVDILVEYPPVGHALFVGQFSVGRYGIGFANPADKILSSLGIRIPKL